MDEAAHHPLLQPKSHTPNGGSSMSTGELVDDAQREQLADEEEFQASVEELRQTRAKIDEIMEKRRVLEEHDRKLTLRIASLEAAINERNREIHKANR